VAYRSSTTTSFSGTTVLTATAPAGVVAGDRLLAGVAVDGTITVTPATNWTNIGSTLSMTVPDTQGHSLHEKKVATGSDLYNFVGSSVAGAIIQVVCLSNRHATTAAVIGETNPNTGNVSPFTMTLTGVTAAQDDDIIAFSEINGSAQTDTWGTDSPTNYTERHDAANSDWVCAETNTRDNVSAGATGSLTMTATIIVGTNNAGYSAFVVAVPSASTSVNTGLPDNRIYYTKTFGAGGLRA